MTGPSGRSTAAATRGRLLEIGEDCPGYLDLLIRNEEVARSARPGQFVRLRCWSGGEPLLPRPFDIVQADPRRGTFRLIVKTVGMATSLLREKKPGDEIEVHGPCGRGIERLPAARIALLARGVGAAAVVFLAETAAGGGAEVHTFLSAASADRLVCRSYLEPVSRSITLCTDDGSAGDCRDAAACLGDALESRRFDRVYTCGSRRFARFVQQADAAGKTAGYLFLEGVMACGSGACHGCAVARSDGAGYFLVCRDGPVFPASQVVAP